MTFLVGKAQVKPVTLLKESRRRSRPWITASVSLSSCSQGSVLTTVLRALLIVTLPREVWPRPTYWVMDIVWPSGMSWLPSTRA